MYTTILYSSTASFILSIASPLPELVESNMVGSFSETLPTYVETILSYQAMRVAAYTTLSRARPVTSVVRKPHI